MKPSLDEVLQKLISLNTGRKLGRNWVFIEELAEELRTHRDNIVPSLLQLEQEECLRFNKGKSKLAVNLLNKAPVEQQLAKVHH